MGRALALACFVSLVALLTVSALAQPTCDAGAVAAEVDARRDVLLQAKIEEMASDVPQPLRLEIAQLKDALAKAVDEAMRCAADGAAAATIQQTLARLLSANQPEKPFVPVPPTPPGQPDPPQERVYGADLRVEVSAPANLPKLRVVIVSFGIQCGTDAMLLLYQPGPGGWHRALRWQSGVYDEVSGAFGDWLLYAVLPGERGSWKFAAAHGTAWCTSRFSSFELALLAPAQQGSDPARVLWRTRRGYSRGDAVVRLRATPDSFELRLNAGTWDVEAAFERAVIYRYQVAGSSVTRIEPIAANARGFVEEWLTMPWDEAKLQAQPTELPQLRGIHALLALKSESTAGVYVSHGYGPVTSCAKPNEAQVEVHSTRETILPGKPGGKSQTLPSTFFRLREMGDGYTLLGAGDRRDPACNGPDLMKHP